MLCSTKYLTSGSLRSILRHMAAPAHHPPALHDRALQDLSFIRRTMEGAAAFTDVPGWGLVGMGAMALAAAPVAAMQPTIARWLAVWMLTAPLATAVGAWTMWQKMRRRVSGDGAFTLSVPEPLLRNPCPRRAGPGFEAGVVSARPLDPGGGRGRGGRGDGAAGRVGAGARGPARTAGSRSLSRGR